MSSNLVFLPVKPEKVNCLSDELKHIFNKKFDLQDGAYHLNNSHISYLEGLLDGSIKKVKKDVARLIDNIKKYDEVKIWLEY